METRHILALSGATGSALEQNKEEVMKNQRHKPSISFLNRPRKGVKLMIAKKSILSFVLIGIMAKAPWAQFQWSSDSASANNGKSLVSSSLVAAGRDSADPVSNVLPA